MKDEIIEELWRAKDDLAREANYDIHALCRELRKKEASSPDQVVDRSAARQTTAGGKSKRLEG
ncbi:MAG: hypothetical protein NTW86_15200 [Candidatus Sumerlaeota bacterium]|nr:hypothetical protein [Candidatus Sumerlaeota bacterium]